jgi:hypothetical protein
MLPGPFGALVRSRRARALTVTNATAQDDLLLGTRAVGGTSPAQDRLRCRVA